MSHGRGVARVGLASAVLVLTLLAARPAESQTLRLRVNPSTLSFPDANPTTTPVISGNQAIRVRVRVRNAAPTDTWSVNALAAGELLSGPDSIPIVNTAWSVTQGGGSCNCTCQVGTNSNAVPQLMLIGQGNTSGSDVRCRQTYTLTNSWAYQPGSYTQIVTITLTSP